MTTTEDRVTHTVIVPLETKARRQSNKFRCLVTFQAWQMNSSMDALQAGNIPEYHSETELEYYQLLEEPPIQTTEAKQCKYNLMC